VTSPYPWFERQWAELLRMTVSGRLSHALLLSGRPGTGCDELAIHFARRLLCEDSRAGDAACGECRACTLLLANNHPDYKTLIPAEAGKAIVVDQVRELAEFYALKPHYQRGKVTLICPADAMNRAAANALLKILEEPPSGAVLILVSHNFSSMPMTVRSRCFRIACEQIDLDTAKQWLVPQFPALGEDELASLLRQAGGAPLRALALGANANAQLEPALLARISALQQARVHPLAATGEFKDLNLDELMQLLSTTVARLIFMKFSCSSVYESPGRDPDPGLQALVDHLNLKHLYAFLDLLFETKALIAGHTGFREADISESLWLGLARAIRGGP